jgi:hypothetical protein
MGTLFEGVPWITPPEVFESVCRLFESLEPKSASADQIFGLGSPLPAWIRLKEGLHFLKRLGIPTQLIQAVTRPKQGRLRDGMGRIFFMDSMKELMSFFIDAAFESDPSA